MKKKGIIILAISEVLMLGIWCLIGEITRAWFYEAGKGQLLMAYCSPLLAVVLLALPPLVISKCKGLFKQYPLPNKDTSLENDSGEENNKWK